MINWIKSLFQKAEKIKPRVRFRDGQIVNVIYYQEEDMNTFNFEMRLYELKVIAATEKRAPPRKGTTLHAY